MGHPFVTFLDLFRARSPADRERRVTAEPILSDHSGNRLADLLSLV